ncbi:hypothetical protein PG989_014705 [Apiospora arundinis]
MPGVLDLMFRYSHWIRERTQVYRNAKGVWGGAGPVRLEPQRGRAERMGPNSLELLRRGRGRPRPQKLAGAEPPEAGGRRRRDAELLGEESPRPFVQKAGVHHLGRETGGGAQQKPASR